MTGVQTCALPISDFTQDEAGVLVNLLIKLLAAAERVAGGVVGGKEIEE